MFIFIQLIKFLATALITNSHFDYIYPIKSLATGGSLGNALFFAVSGYLLYNIKGNFRIWYLRRTFRIYPSVLIVSFLIAIIRWKPLSLITIVTTFIFPTQFWFVAAILVFYILIFVIQKTSLKNYIRQIILGLFIPYFFIYLFFLDTSTWVIEGENLFKWIFYFQIMLFGSTIRKSFETGAKRFNISRQSILLIFGLIGYFGFKLIMDHSQIAMHFQFAEQLLTFPIVYNIFVILGNFEPIFKKYSDKWFIKVPSFIGNLTLDIYLVQLFIINKCLHLSFPTSFILATSLIMLVAYLVHIISNPITQYLDQTIGTIGIKDKTTLIS